MFTPDSPTDVGLRVLPFVVLFAALILATAFTFGTIGEPANQVTLPIEVFPLDGASTHIEPLTVSLSAPSEAQKLYIKGHALGYHKSDFADNNGYDQKASFRINGGAWVAISNANATCVGPGRKYPITASGTTRGCIGGPFHTLQLELPISGTGALTSPDNTIEFRFNGTDGFGSGYRILDLELRNSSGQDLIDGTTFQETDYTTWSAPSGADASNGKQLWTMRNKLVEGPSGEAIVASCSDCHAVDGRDLKYFNYSNRSIEARARFHGLTQEQAEDIAAYIRSADLDLPSGYNVNDTGRPWNPPYQPGPGLDDKPVELWAAGAGVEWVLDGEREDPNTKRDMLTYLFPNGFNLDRIHPDETLNNREIPLAIMMPDWNNWLPDIHPFDRYNEGKSGVQNARLWTYYQDLHEKLDTPSERDAQVQEARDYVGDRFDGGIVDLFSKLDNSGRKQTEGLTEKSEYDGEEKLDNLSLHLWLVVKQWEVNQMYKLEDLGHEVYKDLPLRLSDNDRMWLGNTNNLFDAGPHKNSRPEYPSAGPYPDSDQNVYFTTAWYQMQLMINSMSNGDNAGGKPMDWNYHHEQGIRSTEQSYPQTSHWLRFIASQIQIHQDQSNFHELGVEGDYSREYKKGWQFRNTRPWRLVWGLEDNFPDQNLVGSISDAVLRSWLEETERYTRDDWPVSDGDDGVPDSDYDDFTGEANIGNNGFSPDHFYTMLKEMANDGTLSTTTLDRAARWGESMWPNGNWEQWMSDGSGDDGSTTNASPSVSITGPTDGATFSAPATISLSADASDSDGSVASVTFYSGNTKIGEATSSPYEATWSDVSAGTYTLTAEATDDDGATTTSASISVTASASLTENNGLSYSYYEGDWSQLPDFGSLTAVSTGTTSDISTTVRERDNLFGLRFIGYVEISSSDTGTYTFYTNSDDGSRLLVNGQEIVSNDGIHAPEEASGSVNLSAGWHKITVEYFEQEGGEELSASWKGPSLSKQEIPPSRLYLSPETSQEVTLNAGWNLISSRLAPSDNTISTLFSTVESELVVVQNQQGDSYDPTVDTNSLTTWDSSQGYRVYMSGSQTLSISGSSMASNTLSLEAGWNLIPFYPSSEMAVEDALSAISNELEIVKDETGNSYIPARGLNEIGTLKPGRAYKVYVSTSTSLTYP